MSVMDVNPRILQTPITAKSVVTTPTTAPISPDVSTVETPSTKPVEKTKSTLTMDQVFRSVSAKEMRKSSSLAQSKLQGCETLEDYQTRLRGGYSKTVSEAKDSLILDFKQHQPQKMGAWKTIRSLFSHQFNLLKTHEAPKKSLLESLKGIFTRSESTDQTVTSAKVGQNELVQAYLVTQLQPELASSDDLSLCKAFEHFASKEFGQENILFMKATMSLACKDHEDPAFYVQMGKIVEHLVMNSGKESINVGGNNRKKALKPFQLLFEARPGGGYQLKAEFNPPQTKEAAALKAKLTKGVLDGLHHCQGEIMQNLRDMGQRFVSEDGSVDTQITRLKNKTFRGGLSEKKLQAGIQHSFRAAIGFGDEKGAFTSTWKSIGKRIGREYHQRWNLKIDGAFKDQKDGTVWGGTKGVFAAAGMTIVALSKTIVDIATLGMVYPINDSVQGLWNEDFAGGNHSEHFEIFLGQQGYFKHYEELGVL